MAQLQQKRQAEREECYYLLVTSDPYMATSDARGSAYALVKKRMRRALWDIYKRTSFKDKIQAGDKVCFYVAGTKSHKGQIVGQATISDVSNSVKNTPEHEEYCLSPPVKQLILKDVKEIEPINFREKFFSLPMGQSVNREKWGAALMGGVKRLSREDWEAIGLE